MRPRRLLVKVHRWLSIALVVWFAIVTLTGSYLVFNYVFERWMHPERYTATEGDVGPQAAMDAAVEAGGGEESAAGFYVVMPHNGSGVYQVAIDAVDPSATVDGEPAWKEYLYFVDPGTGDFNGSYERYQGLGYWMERGHFYLWQDNGPFAVFGEGGWCHPAEPSEAELEEGIEHGPEPGGVKGVVCDVVPDGMDTIGWVGVTFIIVLLTGFYLWYWPGVRRWATALVIKRNRGAFTFNMGLHKVIGFVVWFPLLVIAVTGIAFAFPKVEQWYQTASPARTDFHYVTWPDELELEPAGGREPLGLDEMVGIMSQQFPDRRVELMWVPWDEGVPFQVYSTRGFSPNTREEHRGNAYTLIDPHSGEVLFDSTPGSGNVFDQAWDDYLFPVHAGDFLGTPSRLVWFVLGLAPIALGTTGIVMYLIRRRKRRNRRSGQNQVSAISTTR